MRYDGWIEDIIVCLTGFTQYTTHTMDVCFSFHSSMKGAASLAGESHCSCLGTASTAIKTGAESTFSQDVTISRLTLACTAICPCPENSSQQLQTPVCRPSLCYTASPSQSTSLLNHFKTCSSNESKHFTLSLLLKQLRMFAFLSLLAISLFNQIDVASARAIQQQRQGQEGNIPDRCRLPFSYYSCGGFQEMRYTYRNGSCHHAIEWSGPGCEYDGTENSFATEEECLEVCSPPIPTTGTYHSLCAHRNHIVWMLLVCTCKRCCLYPAWTTKVTRWSGCFYLVQCVFLRRKFY